MATALELGRAGWGPYLNAVGRSIPEEPAKRPRQPEMESLLQRVREVAVMLKSCFGVRRVVLFGSLAHSGWFADDSDVDLAVEGLPAAQFWEAWRMVEQTIDDRPVDLIEIESAPQSLCQAIRRHGVEL